MVLEIENAPGQPKWVWLPSLVPIISVGWNFEAKWRACGNARDRNYLASSVHRPFSLRSIARRAISSSQILSCSKSILKSPVSRSSGLARHDSRAVVEKCYRF